jgi:hypothetical protein
MKLPPKQSSSSIITKLKVNLDEKFMRMSCFYDIALIMWSSLIRNNVFIWSKELCATGSIHMWTSSERLQEDDMILYEGPVKV